MDTELRKRSQVPVILHEREFTYVCKKVVRTVAGRHIGEGGPETTSSGSTVPRKRQAAISIPTCECNFLLNAVIENTQLLTLQLKLTRFLFSFCLN